MAAAASDALLAAGVALSIAAAAPRARADELDVLEAERSALRVESAAVRLTGFVQDGHGYQSQAGPVLGPGSERLSVFEPQGEVVLSQGPRLRHRVWLPFDMVTAASPNSISRGRVDVTSGASRHVEGGTLDWTTAYKANEATDVSMRAGMRLENPFRSWHAGLAAARSFADQNTVLSGSALSVFDWFDRFDISGRRFGRTERTTTTGSFGVTQVLSPTTVANLNYGLSVQEGTLGNTWNSVPLASGARGAELLPSSRARHALVARAAQFLPWNGALRLYYRLYADDWGILAHSAEAQLMQRLTPEVYVGALYRFHTQTGATFFTTLAPDTATLRVADSDLATLDSHTFGGKVVADLPLARRAGRAPRTLHLELEYDRYTRTNDLRVDVVTCSTGFGF